MHIDIEKELMTHSIKAASVAFMGPRPAKLGGYDLYTNYAELAKDVKDLIEQFVKASITTFVTNGAQGFSQLTFWSVYDVQKTTKNVHNNLYIPFETQDKNWDCTGIFGQIKYREMRSNADNKKFFTDIQESDTYEDAVKAFHGCDEAIINTTDLLVALYPSYDWMKDADDETAIAMQYAVKTNKPILQLLYVVENDMPRITECAIIK